MSFALAAPTGSGFASALSGSVLSGPVFARPSAASEVGIVPPSPTIGRLLWHVTPEFGPIAMVVVMAGLYLFGVRRLVARGDSWDPWRTVAWLGGVAVIAYALIGGVAAYDTTLFSAHAVQHMLLGTVAPLPLALGAPVTLALRTLPPRPRRLLIAALHSRVARVLTFPLVGFVLFIVSLYGLYFTSLYQDSLEHPWFHLLVHVHFLVVGCLFYWPIVGVDPIPGRLPYWGRLILLFITFPVHALWALAMFTTNQVFAQSWYDHVHRTWGASLINDQHTGAGLMWAAGELVGVLVFLILFIQWSRADAREAVRVDRRLDREERLAAAALPRPAKALDGELPAGGPPGGASVESGASDAERDGGDVAEVGVAIMGRDRRSAADQPSLEDRENAYNAWLASLAAAEKRP
ncbi:MAG: cytochrome c oxidase assembly protein [Frankia sp.]